MVTENVTKVYRKGNESELNEVNIKVSKIAQKEKLENRMEIFTPGEAYITIKDHKPDFPGKISCWLINPAKTDVGKLSRKILQDKVTELHDKLQINQWKSTNEVLEWFASLKYTKESVKNQKIKFIKFNKEAFYPSITEELLNKSIKFAQESGVFFSTTDLDIVKTARESFLFRNGVPYVKKGRNSQFDVIMGSWDGAKISELCGVYLLKI